MMVEFGDGFESVGESEVPATRSEESRVTKGKIERLMRKCAQLSGSTSTKSLPRGVDSGYLDAQDILKKKF